MQLPARFSRCHHASFKSFLEYMRVVLHFDRGSLDFGLAEFRCKDTMLCLNFEFPILKFHKCRPHVFLHIWKGAISEIVVLDF